MQFMERLHDLVHLLQSRTQREMMHKSSSGSVYLMFQPSRTVTLYFPRISSFSFVCRDVVLLISPRKRGRVIQGCGKADVPLLERFL